MATTEFLCPIELTIQRIALGLLYRRKPDVAVNDRHGTKPSTFRGFVAHLKLHVYKKIFGPLLDRIDIHIEVPAVAFDELSAKSTIGTTSQQMREDVVRAREQQDRRFGGDAMIRYNAQMSSRQVREHCALDSTCQQMLRHSVEEMGLSARAHDKILRLARTIADVASNRDINETHLAEAIGYRSLDRDLWI